MVDITDVAEGVVNVLNTYLEDPYLGSRAGSHIFRPEQDLNFSRYMPKGQVKYGIEDNSWRTFGKDFKQKRDYQIFVGYFTSRGDVGSGSTANLKNETLIERQLRNIHEVMKTYGSQVEGVSYIGHETIEPPMFIEEQNVYIGVITLKFSDKG